VVATEVLGDTRRSAAEAVAPGDTRRRLSVVATVDPGDIKSGKFFVVHLLRLAYSFQDHVPEHSFLFFKKRLLITRRPRGGKEGKTLAFQALYPLHRPRRTLLLYASSRKQRPPIPRTHLSPSFYFLRDLRHRDCI
jgi:hypothetical protein